MNLELDVGLGSIYFISDVERGVGMLQNPRLLLARRTLLTEDMARFVARHPDAGLPEDELGFYQALQMLHDVGADRNVVRAIAMPEPILVIAVGIEAGLLAGLKRLKLRGLADLLAIRGGIEAVELDEPLTHLTRAFDEHLLYADDDQTVLAFRAIQRLSVVSGLRKTVLSTDVNCEEIVRSRPDLWHDVSILHEPL